MRRGSKQNNFQIFSIICAGFCLLYILWWLIASNVQEDNIVVGETILSDSNTWTKEELLKSSGFAPIEYNSEEIHGVYTYWRF